MSRFGQRHGLARVMGIGFDPLTDAADAATAGVAMAGDVAAQAYARAASGAKARGGLSMGGKNDIEMATGLGGGKGGGGGREENDGTGTAVGGSKSRVDRVARLHQPSAVDTHSAATEVGRSASPLADNPTDNTAGYPAGAMDPSSESKKRMAPPHQPLFGIEGREHSSADAMAVGRGRGGSSGGSFSVRSTTSSGGGSGRAAVSRELSWRSTAVRAAARALHIAGGKSYAREIVEGEEERGRWELLTAIDTEWQALRERVREGVRGAVSEGVGDRVAGRVAEGVTAARAYAVQGIGATIERGIEAGNAVTATAADAVGVTVAAVTAGREGGEAMFESTVGRALEAFSPAARHGEGQQNDPKPGGTSSGAAAAGGLDSARTPLPESVHSAATAEPYSSGAGQGKAPASAAAGGGVDSLETHDPRADAGNAAGAANAVNDATNEAPAGGLGIPRDGASDARDEAPGRTEGGAPLRGLGFKAGRMERQATLKRLMRGPSVGYTEGEGCRSANYNNSKVSDALSRLMVWPPEEVRRRTKGVQKSKTTAEQVAEKSVMTRVEWEEKVEGEAYPADKSGRRVGFEDRRRGSSVSEARDSEQKGVGMAGMAAELDRGGESEDGEDGGLRFGERGRGEEDGEGAVRAEGEEGCEDEEEEGGEGEGEEDEEAASGPVVGFDGIERPAREVLERNEVKIRKHSRRRTLKVVRFASPHILICIDHGDDGQEASGVASQWHGGGAWPANLFFLLRQLRSSAVVHLPVVLLHRRRPDHFNWGCAGLFPGVYFVHGCPRQELDLIRAGAHVAGEDTEGYGPVEHHHAARFVSLSLPRKNGRRHGR